MPRTVLGWRCRRGSGRSLPTSYTSPQAGNKPPVVFPILRFTRTEAAIASLASPLVTYTDPGSPLRKYVFMQHFGFVRVSY